MPPETDAPATEARAWKVVHGDCLDVMREMDAASVDAIVTDPPYALTANKKGGTGPASLNVASPAGRARVTTGFMGKAWDGKIPGVEVWAEVLRVAKPGAHLLAFGGTRTFHRLICAIEDAGWEIRDCIMWVYGSGFPKSHQVGAAVHRRLGQDGACQCAAKTCSNENTSAEPQLCARTGNHPAASGDALPLAGVPRLTNRETDSQVCCPTGSDSDDEQPRPDEAAAQSPLPSPGCAPKHTRSVSPDDALASAPTRSLSRAPRSAPLTKTGCSRPSVVDGDARHHNAENTSPAGTSELAHRKPDNHRGVSHEKVSGGLELCPVCGKPKAYKWDGWGTALKPAWEPIIVAMKPLDGTFAENAQSHGVAGLNIDGCRVGKTVETWPQTRNYSAKEMSRPGSTRSVDAHTEPTGPVPSGRWPANLIHDGSEEVVGLFPSPHGAGHIRSAAEGSHSGGNGGSTEFCHGPAPRFGDVGSAARFFYTAKASRSEREAGLEGLDPSVLARSNQAAAEAKRGNIVDEAGGAFNPARIVRNNHPTVKPLSLLTYLCKLVRTPTGGLILDPFCGSGTTGLGAVANGQDCILIDDVAGYCEISSKRMAAATNQTVLDLGT